METERFEALIDAILAIIITLIVMEIPFPSTTTWMSLFELYPIFIAYTISFIICFYVWHYHHNLFRVVNKLDSTITWTSGLSMMIIGLLPHATLMVATDFYSFTAQATFGLIFFIANITFYIADMMLIRKDPANIALKLMLKTATKDTINTAIMIIIGYILGYLISPPAIMIMSLVTMLFNFIPGETKRKVKLPF